MPKLTAQEIKKAPEKVAKYSKDDDHRALAGGLLSIMLDIPHLYDRLRKIERQLGLP